ncbi:MAG: hypothetical protein ACRELB_11695 [Polyangiaceae bacterium]
MPKPAAATSAPTSFAALVIKKTPPLRWKPLVRALQIVKAAEARGEKHIYEDVMPPATLFPLLQEAIDAEQGAESAVATQKAAVARLDTLEPQGERMLTRLDDKVNAIARPGDPTRAAYYPTSGGVHALSAQLAQMAAGFRANARNPPRGLTVAAIEAFASALKQCEDARTAAGGGKTGTSSRRAQLRPKVRGLERALVSNVRSELNRDSEDLTAYGLKPRRPRAPGKGRGKKSAPAGKKKSGVTPPASGPAPH